MSEPVRSARTGIAARALVALAIEKHLSKRARELAEITKDLHRTAPRGGAAVNRFGERRSAPGEAPAMESGGLFAEIDQGVEKGAREVRVLVILAVLEYGTPKMRPRPLGKQASAALKERIR